MKILVTGAYSTGKSILVQHLARRLEGLGLSVLVLSDSSREIDLPLNRNQGHDTTLWLLSWQISKERLASCLDTSKRIIICDRGVPDILAHNLEAKSRGQDLKNDLAYRAGVEWCSSYDLSFFSKIDEEIPIEADGIRVTDPGYRRLMESFASESIEYVNPCLTMPLALADRVAFASSRIVTKLDRS